MTLDVVELELLYHKVTAIAEEMGIALSRTARSSYVRETHDFATALATPGGRFFAYPRGMGVLMGIDQDLAALLAAVPDVSAGDVLITNHPYLAPGTASHLPDFNLARPYFDEDELLCYGWSFAHAADIGGDAPSSISPSFQSIAQEGFALPPCKLVTRGVVDEELWARIRGCSRVPDVVMGDLRAQLSALDVGARRVADLVSQHGRRAFLEAQRGLVDYATTRAREVLRRLPDGVYEAHDYLDDDFHSRLPVRFRCRLEVRDGAIHLDLTGTDPQLAAPYNIPTAGRRHPFLSAKLLHLLVTLDPDLPLNHGLLETISVHVPKGTLIHPEMPAPVGIRHASGIRLNDAVLAALSQADPSLAPAASGGTVIPAVVAQHDAATGRSRVTVIQSLAGGAGATPRHDGANGRDRSLANIHNTPTELAELDADVCIERYGIRPDSGGAGRYRGGTGVIYVIRALAALEVMGRGLERFVFQPPGLRGGHAGATARVVLHPGTPDERDLGKIDRVRLGAGDRLAFMTPGGGGHGHPFDRPAAEVARDVRLGYVTHAAALADYGVAIDLVSGAVDEDATAVRRSNRRATPVDVQFGPARAYWERVFDDALTTRLAAVLLAVPADRRVEVRRAAYDRVVPGVVQAGPSALSAQGFDVSAAVDRLLHVIEELEARWPS